MGVGLPPTLVEFFSHHHFYKLSHSWLLGVPLLLPSPAGLLCGIFPPCFFGAQGTRPLCYMSFLFLLLIIQVFFLFFPSVGVWSVQGTMLICPRIFYGSTECRLAHFLVHVFPSCLGAAIWHQHGRPPGFSI
jgi:hypothetical protein